MSNTEQYRQMYRGLTIGYEMDPEEAAMKVMERAIADSATDTTAGHQYLPETLSLIEQAERDIAAEKAATDTTAVDNQQLAGIFAHLQVNQAAAQGDPQWAGPSLPHPTEATSEQEYDDLAEGWDNWAKGIDPNHLAEGHNDEALEA